VVAGAKGGIGTSTVAINLAATQAASKGAEAVADLAVPIGTLGSMLNIGAPDRWAWGEVLDDGASVHRLSSYLMRNPQVPFRLLSGVRGSPYQDVRPEAVSKFATSLRGLAETIVVDLGNQPSPFVPPMLREADVICVVVEPEVNLRRTNRALPGSAAINRHPQPSHPARDFECARRPAAESHRGGGRLEDGGGGA
jgi:pilus assembly protein CpaE